MSFKREFDPEDRISHLSDDVLISILSHLPMRVAATTSLLSRRWGNVWTFLPRLEFDASNTILKIKNQTLGSNRTLSSKSLRDFIDSEKVRFVNMVNHFVELYSLPVTEEFRICFDLNRRHKQDIDKWVKLCPRSLGLPSYILLTSLVLKCIDVSDDVIENFVSNSPFLECLCVQPPTLVHVRVVGPSLHLRSLEISGCSSLKSLQLHATNLLSFKYFGPEIEIPFENVPNLTALCIKDYAYPPPILKLPRVLTFFPQLHKLSLAIDDVKISWKN
ncbi:hypothetical protein F3Y22_tig00110194pilonHSYRG00070 [Hibiscus syriacus]|uniref:F-box domain-containing protein n=1 Tax=Hibiscus syriacus TaxID=106335 RepID=A0A6A3BCF0_HIBSY|nr:putative F-box/LRR-repeat protein At4g15060 [Hibiscus syriacus]KAE8714700.1 hypothetical protein F3Y22_tig00110194pilonHSYRG00070 [Hibiscus syriacus]